MSDNKVPPKESDKKQPAKKQKVLKQSHRGIFLDSSKNIRQKKGSTRFKNFAATAGSDLVGDKHKCDYCGKTFLAAKALAHYLNFCQLAIAQQKEGVVKMTATGIAMVFGGSAATTKQQQPVQLLVLPLAFLIQILF